MQKNVTDLQFRPESDTITHLFRVAGLAEQDDEKVLYLAKTDVLTNT